MFFLGNQEITSSYARAKFVSAFTDFFALIYHIVIQVFFLQFRVMPMFFYNIISVSIFVFLLFAIYRVKSFIILFFIAYIEVMCHQILAEYFMGSETCFHYFVLMMGLLPFLVFEKKLILATIVSVISSVIFIILESISFTPKYIVSLNIVNTLKYLNMTITIIVIIFMVGIFTISVYKIEDNLEAKNRGLEKEIRMASVIQQNFFKQDVSQINNFDLAFYSKPMAGVSGDLYDFFRTGNNLEGLGIFDVSGHGISSGLVTMLVKNIIHQEFYTKEKMDLWEILNNINGRVIQEKGDIENYLTGILIKTNKENIEVAIAGHPRPIFYHHKTGICEFLQMKKESVGAIGIPGFPVYYTSQVYNFEEGDELFIYSDGLVDTVNERKEDFGKDRLLNLIYRVCDMPAKMQMVEVEKQIAMFQGRAPQKDDLTFIILKK